jgi:F-type H+-transporting ATPase subunit delta
MNGPLVSERYARALFELALEKKAEEEVYRDSLVLSRACETSRELRHFLKSPIINAGKKLAVLKELFEGRIHHITMTYILIMVKKKRESFIPSIALQVSKLYQEYRNILTVRFRSPVLPDDETRKQVIELMQRYTRASIELDSGIDESLIGGFVLSWDDKQYDASIRREIENMRNTIAKVNLYKKGF